jgi:hypothetical protein
LWAATEAREIGWGGMTLVEQATGISQKTIRKGLLELHDDAPDRLPADRSRKNGAGRKKVIDNDKQLLETLETLIDPVTRGDPESPLRWTCKSTRRQGHSLRGV